MAINLMDVIGGYMGSSLMEQAAQFLGEDSSKAQSAVKSAIPSVLGGLMQKVSSGDGASAIFSLLNQSQNDGSVLNGLGDLFGNRSAMDNHLGIGSTLLNTIFGNKLTGILDLVTKSSGMSGTSTSTLMKWIAPIVMGVLGKQVKSQGLGMSGLVDLLKGQSGFLKTAAPAGLLGSLGLSSFDNIIGSSVNAVSDAGKSTYNAGKTVVTETADAGSSLLKKLLPFLGIALLALLGFWFMKGCGGKAEEITKDVAATTVDATKTAVDATATAAATAVDATATAAATAVDATANAANSAWAALGSFFKKKLPNGIELNIPEKGVENKLISFIEDKTKAIDKKTWFSFDRLLFDTGKSTLKAESQDQLKATAEIMKAFPTVEIKLGGYTDNVGDPKSNLKLSQDRANTVMAELVKLGVAASRMLCVSLKRHPTGERFYLVNL